MTNVVATNLLAVDGAMPGILELGEKHIPRPMPAGSVNAPRANVAQPNDDLRQLARRAKSLERARANGAAAALGFRPGLGPDWVNPDRIGLSASCRVYPPIATVERTSCFGSFVPNSGIRSLLYSRESSLQAATSKLRRLQEFRQNWPRRPSSVKLFECSEFGFWEGYS